MLAPERSYAILAEGVAFPEGLAWSETERCLYLTAVAEGRVYRLSPERSELDLLADVAGGANNCALAADGGCLVTQNGGIDATEAMARYVEMPPLPPVRPTTPGLLRVNLDGSVESLLDGGLNAPNDLAVGQDGALYLTDPGNPFLDQQPPRRVMRYSPAGELSVYATGFTYCNGIAVDGESLIVSDRVGVLRLWQGGREWIVRDQVPTPDGIALDEAGRLYVAGGHDGCVYVIEDGRVVDSLVTPAPYSRITNCCFGGVDRRSLFVTDAANWTVAVWSDMPSPGRELPSWSGR